MITKNELALAAFEELRISGLTSKATPEEISSAINRLDTMMASWKNDNVCIGYIFPSSYGKSGANDDSGICDSNIFAVVANLAKVSCAKFGKVCHPQTKIDAHNGYNNLIPIILPEKENDPYLPKGAGESFAYGYYGVNYYQKYFPENESAPNNCDTLDIKVGQTDSYSIDFNCALVEGETIDTFTVDDGQGVSVLSSSELDGVITLSCEGLTAGYAPVIVTITTTPSAFVDPYSVNFNVLAV